MEVFTAGLKATAISKETHSGTILTAGPAVLETLRVGPFVAHTRLLSDSEISFFTPGATFSSWPNKLWTLVFPIYYIITKPR